MSLCVVALAAAALIAAGQAEAATCMPGAKAEPPSWSTARRATVLVDSVLLGGMRALRSNMVRWRLDVVGRPAIMLDAMERELRSSGGRIAPLVVIGIGYNSLWEHDRRNFAHWAHRFDRQAIGLLRTLKRQGAEQFVWVTLRQARRSVIPASALWQYDKYAWYFPYVNERLRRLGRRRGDLVLADWAAVSNRRGITYDAIHLDPEGAALMARTIRKAIETEARRQRLRSRCSAPLLVHGSARLPRPERIRSALASRTNAVEAF